jgi:bacterioferritin-associated ferredoxin
MVRRGRKFWRTMSPAEAQKGGYRSLDETIPALRLLTIIRIRVHNTGMIVCICKAVSDRQIRAAVKGGATRLTDLSRQTGLGTCCGKCLPEARRTLADSLNLRHDDQGSRQEACPYFANPLAASI